MKTFRTLAASAILVGASSAAFAFPTFQVQESSIAPLANLVTADRISFEYNATIDQTIVGGSLAGADDPFTEVGFFNKGAFSSGGAAVPSQLNALGGYGLYGLFTITGEGDLGAAPGSIKATFQTMTMTLWADVDQDTTLALAGLGVAVGGDGEDIKLADYTLNIGEANVAGGLANGDFDTLLNIALTPAGMAYFVSPNPFFPLENFGGNTETISGASLTESFVATATGGGIELFQAVPEPTTVALLGIGLLGMGIGSKRRVKKA